MALPNGELQITPLNPQHAYPVDKRMQTDTLNSRDSISPYIRWRGMQVHVLENDTTYLLKGGVTNEFWTVLGEGSGSGGTTFVGQFETVDLLPATATTGDYAYVGDGENFLQYNWDNIASKWVSNATNLSPEKFYTSMVENGPVLEKVIFTKTLKDEVMEEDGAQVIYPSEMKNFIFTGSGVVLEGVGYADEENEFSVENRTDGTLSIITNGGVANAEFAVSTTIPVGGKKAFKGNGTTWDEVEVNEIAFSDAINSHNAKTSIGPDGLEIISELINIQTGEKITIKETTTYIDGTLMNDSKVDNTIYFKSGSKYYCNTRFLRERIIYGTDFGLLSDGITDNSIQFQEIENFLNNTGLERLHLIIPSGVYYTTHPLHIRRLVSFTSLGTIKYGGVNTSPALRFGNSNGDNTDVSISCRVERSSQSDWTDGSIGVEFINLNGCRDVNIGYVRFFNESIRCLGDGRGFAYNKIHLGSLRDSQIGLRGTNINDGWFNQNTFINGTFSTLSTANPTLARYGIIIDSLDDVYLNNNKNTFISPSFEMASNITETPIIPITIVHGEQNYFMDVRDERYYDNSGPTIITQNNSRYNVLELGYGSGDAVHYSEVVEDQGNDPSTTFIARRALSRSKSPRNLIYNSGDLSKRTCQYDATNIYAENELFFAKATLTTITKTTDATRNDSYISLGGSTAIGVRIDTSKNKRIEVKTLLDPAGRNSRITIKCYDSSGNVLSGSDPKYAKSEIVRQTAPSTNFGGSYRSPSDDVEDWYIVLQNDVAYIDVYISGGSSTAFLKSFSIFALDEGSSIINPYKRDGLYAIVKPTDSTYGNKAIIYNASTSDGTIGWIHMGSGVWNVFGPKPTSDLNSVDVASMPATRADVFTLTKGAAGTFTFLPDVWSANQEFEGLVLSGAKTFVAGAGFDIRIPSGGSNVVNQYERFNLRFLSPTEAVLNIIEPPQTISDASETAKGIIELATQTEVNTGTDAVRAVTPLTLETKLAPYFELDANGNAVIANTKKTGNGVLSSENWIQYGNGASIYNVPTGQQHIFQQNGTTVAGITGDGKLFVEGVGKGLILKSPDGTQYELTVPNGGGSITITAV